MDFRRELARCMGANRLQCTDAPDMSGANAAALKSAELSEKQLEWVKGVYEAEAPAREATRAKANAVSDAQIGVMNQQMGLTSEAADHYRTTFKPIESFIAKEAMGYDTAERRDAAAGQAMADVGTQGDIGRQTTMDELAARGVDPSSGNAAMALQRGSVMEAAAKAAAGNDARTKVETVGRALRGDAANLGRGIASSQATTAGLSLTAGDRAVASSGAGLAAGTAGAGMVQQGYGTAINGLSGASSNLANIGKIEAGSDASGSSGLGSLAGAGMMAFAV
jgi:hypothetical protein